MKLKILTIFVFGLAVSSAANAVDDAERTAQAMARAGIIVDTHIDVPYRLSVRWEDATSRTEGGDFDYERARAGGLDVPFMAIYTPAESEAEGTSFRLANNLIDNVEALVGRAPDKFALVRSPKEAKVAFDGGKIGLAMGMENGSPIEGRLENVAFF